MVVGAGAAGLHAAARAAADGAEVILVSRKPLPESSSYWAQGGLAAALAPDDSPDRHAADTLAAGRGLCRGAAVRALVEEASRERLGRDLTVAVASLRAVIRSKEAAGRDKDLAQLPLLRRTLEQIREHERDLPGPDP